MFERFTEGARRVVFFARYEASNFGTPYIGTDHLLLGILREDKALVGQVLLNVDYESAYQDVTNRVGPKKKNIPTSADLPLAEDAKRVLAYAAEEAERLGVKHIGTEHLLLGLVREAKFPSAEFLGRFGIDVELLRKKIDALPRLAPYIGPLRRAPLTNKVEIHGQRVNADSVRLAVARLREHHFVWERRLWQPRDVVYERDGKSFSFDLTLAQDSKKFLLVKGGWKKDECAICGWELSESEDVAHGAGFTNGRDWVCEECHAKFIAIDFFASTYSDLT